jgi:RHS repeat-associated protein
MKSRLNYWFVCAFLFVSATAFAQVSTGTPPLGSFSPGPDVTNLGNLNVHFTIPVSKKAGRGRGFFYNLSFDNSIWSPTSSSGTASWTPITNWGWRGDTDAAVGYVNMTTSTTTCRADDGTTQHYTVYFFSTYVDEFGTVHTINGRTDTKDQAGCISGTGTQQTTATDASGLTFVLTNDPDATVIGRDGSQFHPPLAIGDFSGSITDRNGNQITTTSGATFVDTLGMTALRVAGAAPSPKTFTYTDSGGTARSVTINYASYTVQTNFGCSGVSEFGPTAASLVNNVTLPDGSSFSFQYEATPGVPANVTGRVKSITLSTGGTITYAYTGGNNGIECGDGSTAGLTRTTADGTTSYSRSGSGTAWATTVTDGLGNQTSINFETAGSPANFYETHRTVHQGASTVLLQSDTCYNAATPNCSNTAITLPITEVKNYVTLNNSQESLTDTFLNTFGLTTEVDEYDFGAAPHGALVRRTLTSYAALNNGLVSFPDKITILDGNAVQKAQQSFAYDETAITATSGVPQHIPISGSRGNVTTINLWVNTTNTNLTATFGYDDTGNVLVSSDPGGNQTQLSYADNFSDGINRGTLAYLTQVTRPTTGGVTHQVHTQYDANTGLTTKNTDENGNATTYVYDSLLRPLTISVPDGGLTTYTYNSAASTTQTTKLTATANTSVTTILDGLGRLSQKQLTSDPAGTVYTDYTYNANGWAASISNPHRTAASSTDGVTQFAYDALGRLTVKTQQDGSTVQSSYSNNCTTTTDEVGNKRQNCNDAFGRVSSVWEDPSGANYETDYTYDTLNNMVTINQKGGSTDSAQWRTRTYIYDSLSRLTQSSTPEQGTTSLAYRTAGGAACSGNPSAVCQKTDARNITTTYAYDALNRVTSKSYSDGTATANFVYDVALGWTNPVMSQTNLVGRLSEASTGSCGGAVAFSYDAMGRIIGNNQQTPSNCGTGNFPVSATYNLAGGITTLTYPSGRLVSYGYNGAGSLNSVQFTQWNGTAPAGGAYTYWSASDANINPAGLPKTWSLGNGVTETVVGNSRMQPSQFTISNPQMTTFLNRTIGYQATGQVNPANNGNIYNVTDQLNGTLTQSFTYDALNRLATANEGRWGLAFVYDPWGNFLQQNLTSGSAGTRSSLADTHNRLTSNTYDSAGNTLNDSLHSYVYDAEGRLNSADSGADTNTYGADSSRVRKVVSGTSTDYIYFGGQVLATRAADGSWQDYIQGSGGQIARAKDLDNGLRVYGTRCSACGSQYMDYYLSNAGGLNNYVIRSGDKLYFTQYQLSGSRGGVVLIFADATNSNWGVKDKEGYYLNDDQSQTTTHFRTVDLTSLAGKKITQLALNDESDTAAGAFAIIYEQMALVSADGTVQPIYTGQPTSPVSSMTGTTGITGAGTHIDVNTGHAIYPNLTTVYFGTDQIGSSRMMTSGYGYPIWQGTFLPYGQEYNQQMKIDNFKFTGLEHDDETGLEHALFRQFSATQGRWTAPDPYAGSMNIMFPQSLNRYNYVANNPVNSVDPSGLVCSGNIGDGPDTVCDPTNFGGGGGSGGNGLGGGFFELMNIPVYGWDLGYPAIGYAGGGWDGNLRFDIWTLGPLTYSPFYMGNALELWPEVDPGPPSFMQSLAKLGDLIKSLIPHVCGGGGYGYAGREVDLFGEVKGEAAAVVGWDSQEGGAHGVVLEAGVGHYAGGYEFSRTWRDWKEHQGPIGFVGGDIQGIGGVKFDKTTGTGGGLFQYSNGQLTLGFYTGFERATYVGGGGGYVSLGYNCK